MSELPSGPRRAALAGLLALLALIAWQTGVGLVAEATRLRETSLAERRDALSIETAGRYRNGLGAGAAWLADLAPRLSPRDLLVVVHDGSLPALRLANGFSVLLFPRRTHVLAAPPGAPARWEALPADVVVAHVGPSGPVTDSLRDEGLVPLVQEDGFQAYGRPATSARADAAPDEHPRVLLPPPLAPQRLSGWRLLTLFALPLVVGLLVLAALGLGPGMEPLACWGWAWMLGCLLVALGLLAWMLLGLPLSALSPPLLGGAAALAGAAGLALRVRSARRRPAPSRVPVEFPGWERALFAVCVAIALALALDRIVLASGSAIVGGDEAGIWAAKAKALWAADGLGPPFDLLARNVAHADYPLLDPLLQVFSFLLAERTLDFENRLPIQLCVPALLLVAAGALRRCARPSVAGLLLLLLATAKQTGVSTRDACADGMVGLGLLAVLDAGERWRASGERRWFLLGALALTFLVGSKNEGLMLALAAVGALLVTGAVRDARAAALAAARATPGGRGPSLVAQALWLCLPLALLAVGRLLNARHGFENDLTARIDGVGMPGRIVANAPVILLPLLSTMGAFFLRGGVETHRLFLAGLVLLLLCAGALLRRDASGRAPAYRAVPVALLLALAGYVLVYVGNVDELYGMSEWLRTTLGRVGYHLFPALVVWLGAASGTLAQRAAGATESGAPGPA